MQLTLPQQDVYFEQLLYPNEPIYNIGAKIAIRGALSEELLQRAYVALINQHDAYRSVFYKKGEQVEVRILEKHHTQLKIEDYSNKRNSHEKAIAFMEEQFRNPFDLNSGQPLHKFILIKVDSKFYYLFSVYHHIITDGWGTSLMFQRLVRNYNELVEHEGIVSEYPFTYKNFVKDDHKYILSDDYTSDKYYWRTKFENLPEQLFERIREGGKTNESSRKELIIKRSLYNQLGNQAKACKCNTFHVILGILFLYFSRKHNNYDFAIGLPILNRGKSIFKKTVGLFMGVSALRMQLDNGDTFAELVQKIRQQLRRDYRHQRFPLGKLVQELGLYQEKNRLFNITLSYEKQNYADHFKNTKTEVVPLSHHSERVALAIYIREFDEQEDVKIDFDYNLNYFDEASIGTLVNHIENLLKLVNATTSLKLSDYNYLSKPERKKVLFDFNQTQFAFPKEFTLLNYFKHQVEVSPEKIALIDDQCSYSFKELDNWSNQVAWYVEQNSGVEIGKPAAVLMNRSAELVVVLLGVLKSGRAFIPLDPEFPEERIGYILSHSQVKCILSQQSLKSKFGDTLNFIDVDAILNKAICLDYQLNTKLKSTDTAYIIYTSGSTGNPKGVEIGHQSLLNFLLSMQQKPGVQETDLLFSVTTPSFDISILEFFLPLITGASVYMASGELLSDPISITQKLKSLQPTVIQATPSFYQMLYNAGWEGANQLKVLCGGDLLSKSLAEKLIDNCKSLWNMYGPTETTIWSSIKEIKDPEEAPVIGKPIHNTQFYILDKGLNPLPINFVGELFIGGLGLAKGYFHNETLTSSRFVSDPFNLSGKMYQTGDLAKWGENGEVEFLGRNDQQVKIRGYRIELGEIETRLNEMDSIKSSVVVAKKTENHGALLIAFIIPQTEKIDLDRVQSNLKAVLPEYMIPYMMVKIDEFPLTPNKKVDRKTLASYKIQLRNSDSIIQKPKNGLESQLCTYYQEILGLTDPIGVSDNFFELGGHSLKAVRMIGLINEKLGFQITLKDLFDNPTVEFLAPFLTNRALKQQNGIQQIPTKPYYDISYAQYVIWNASQHPGKSIAYNMSAAFEVFGVLNIELLEIAFNHVIEKYEVLRTNFIEVEGMPRQKVNSMNKVDFVIKQFCLSLTKPMNQLQQFIDKAFDLENQLLLRVGLFNSQEGKSTLVFVTHHIIMDGWSLEVLIEEVSEIYRTLLNNETVCIKNLDFQFKDYVAWEQQKSIENHKANNLFWQDYLKDFQGRSILMDGFEKIARNSNGGSLRFTWEEAVLSRMRHMVQHYEVSLHTLIVTAFNIVIHKVFEYRDICIGTVNAGRNFPGAIKQIGMFVKTLPFRSIIKQEQKFSDFLLESHQRQLMLDQHQDIPESMRSKLKIEVIIAMQNPNFHYNKISLGNGLQLNLLPIESGFNRLPLLLNFFIVNDQLSGVYNYQTDSFDHETIELISNKLHELIKQILINPELTIQDLNVALPIELEETIEIEFNF